MRAHQLSQSFRSIRSSHLFKPRRGYTSPAIASDETLLARAKLGVENILKNAVAFDLPAKMLILADTSSPLSRALSQAYYDSNITAKPLVRLINMNATTSQEIMDEISFLRANDLVVTVQDSEKTFELMGNYRLRANLFQYNVKNVEHKFLSDINPKNYLTYLDSLMFDPRIESPRAERIKQIVDASQMIEVYSKGTDQKLVFSGTMEPMLLNVGDYSKIKNVGGTYPVGELISELQDLSKLNGTVSIFSYANLNRLLCVPEKSFLIHIENGVVTGSTDAPKDFLDVLDAIRAEEEVVSVREFGLGLNMAMTKDKIVDNITTYERMLGLHLSLGKKHNVFKGRSKSRFHFDLFVDLESIIADGDKVIFQHGAYAV